MRERTGDKALTDAAGAGDQYVEFLFDPGERRERGDELGIVEAASEDEDRRVLIDLAAQTQAPLTRWMDESQLLEVASEIGLHIRYWHVMDNGRDSVDLLRRLFEHYEKRLNYVTVKNHLRGDDFSLLDRSGLMERAQELNAPIISIRRLSEGAINKIDAHSTSFWAAARTDTKEAGALGILERQRVRTWLKSAYEELDRIQP